MYRVIVFDNCRGYVNGCEVKDRYLLLQERIYFCDMVNY